MSEIPPPTIPPATPPPPGGGSYTPPPPPPPGGTSPSSDRTLMVVLAYLGILSLIPYFTKKDDPEVLWHAKNGVGLFIMDIVIWAVFFILGMVAHRIPFAGCGIGTISCIVWLAMLGLHIYCLIKAVNGQRVRIPVVTDFAEKSL